jgi:hypothetical protein
MKPTATSTLLVSAVLVTTAMAHGSISSPTPRQPGPAMAAACGMPAVQAVLSDPTTPLEDVDVSAATPQCRLDLCRGAVFEDNNAKNVLSLTPGQVVRMTAVIPIPHEGPMNVSIIDTATNRAVAPPLISFASYADERLAVLPANNTDFSVRMPKNLAAGQCTVPGQCTMQWFWFGTGAKQTYESCVDFVMAPAGGAAASNSQTAGNNRFLFAKRRA